MAGQSVSQVCHTQEDYGKLSKNYLGLVNKSLFTKAWAKLTLPVARVSQKHSDSGIAKIS